jgi:ferritin-like protein
MGGNYTGVVLLNQRAPGERQERRDTMQFTEPADILDQKTNDEAKALKSLMEEVEAVNYYNQRVAATPNAELKELLAHNRDEEIEHAAMLIEWLRRNMEGWDKELKTYLFTSAPLLEVETAGDAGGGEGGTPGSLGIGSLK